MQKLILDEWLWADLIGDNGEVRKLQSFALLYVVLHRSDRLIVVRDSAFDRKARSLSRSQERTHIHVLKLYEVYFRTNLDNCTMLDQGSLARLGTSLAASVSPRDQYLVRAQATIPGSFIVTTDGKLKVILDQHQLSCVLRDPFLDAYLPPDQNAGRVAEQEGDKTH